MFIGKIDENIGSLLYGNLYKIFGNNWSCYLGNPCYIFKISNTNQYLFENFIFFLNFKYDSILVMNFFMIFTFIISLFIFFKFYYYFINNKLISIFLSILLISSPYFGYQLSLHYELSNIWISILIFYLILKAKKNISFAGIGILLGMLIGISNYIFVYFNIILFIFLISTFIISKKYPPEQEFNFLKIKNIIFMYLTATFVSVILMIPFFNREKITEIPESINSYSRNIDNFIIFSSRPWYFFLPSVDNPIYGKFSNETINYLKNKTQNYLFDNYFKSEHSATFLGITNFVLSILGLGYIRKYKKENKFLYLGLYTTFIFSLLFSLPPVITLANKNIYLPSYIIYKIFPMFRVLSRLGVYTTTILLIFSGFGLIYLKNRFPKNHIYIICVLFTLAFTEFFMKINLTIYDKLHPSFNWVYSNTPKEAIIAIYPINKSRLTMFWLPEIQRKIINPADFKSELTGFDSEKFTKSLISKEGLEEAKKDGVSYLLIYSDSISQEDRLFFENSELLNLEFKSIGIPTKSFTCQNLSFIFNCRDASNLGEIEVFKFR